MTRRHGCPSESNTGVRLRLKAFTLVELLVVASIMVSLFGLVLVGSRPSIGAMTRQSAQQLASVLLAAQSRAIGTPQGAAVILEPDDSGRTCRVVFSGDRSPLQRATVESGMPPEDPAAAVTTVELGFPNGGDPDDRGYWIRFHGDLTGEGPVIPESPWFGFEPTTKKVRFRKAEGQSAFNTVWPSAGGGNVLHASIICYPAKGGKLMEFPKGVGIDLRYSGTGDDPTTTWEDLPAAGEIGLSFDMAGSVDALMRNLATLEPTVREPVEPVFLLVASTAEISNNQSLASERAMWVTVQPQTGRVTVSANLPQSGTDKVAVRAARAAARAALAIGR